MFREYEKQISTFDKQRKERNSGLQTKEEDEQIYHYLQRMFLKYFCLGVVLTILP